MLAHPLNGGHIANFGCNNQVHVHVCMFVLTCPPLHLVVLAALHRKKVIAQRDLQKWKGDAQSMLLDLILDQYTKSPEDVAMTADVLGMFGCKKEAKMLICMLVLCAQLITVITAM